MSSICYYRYGQQYLPEVELSLTSALVGRFMSLIAFCCALPIICTIALILLITQGRPVFYSGERLGLLGRPFSIYKFRTLERNAEARLHGIVCRDVALETPIGRLLRVCRLDELPQLWNLINGTMNWFGPRPMRRSVFEHEGRFIPDYYYRLYVTPGLFGPAQVFLPHSTQKRIRFLFFKLTYFGQYKWTLVRKCKLITFTLAQLSIKTTHSLLSMLHMYYMRRSIKDRRMSQRVRPDKCFLHATQGAKSDDGNALKILEASNAYILVHYNSQVAQLEKGEILVYAPHKKNGEKLLRVKCTFTKKIHPANQQNTLLLFYQVPTEFNRYIIERYILKRSIL